MRISDWSSDVCSSDLLNDFMSGPQGGEAAFAFIRAIANFGKPAVAAVQGLAVGVGTTMLFHCDLVYAAPDARFPMQLGIASCRERVCMSVSLSVVAVSLTKPQQTNLN